MPPIPFMRTTFLVLAFSFISSIVFSLPRNTFDGVITVLTVMNFLFLLEVSSGFGLGVKISVMYLRVRSCSFFTSFFTSSLTSLILRLISFTVFSIFLTERYWLKLSSLLILFFTSSKNCSTNLIISSSLIKLLFDSSFHFFIQSIISDFVLNDFLLLLISFTAFLNFLLCFLFIFLSV